MNIYTSLTPEIEKEINSLLQNRIVIKRHLKQSPFSDYFKEVSTYFNIKNSRQILYLALHQKEPTCLTCGGKVKWKEYRYRTFCSNKCSNSNQLTKNKIKTTCLTKYGTENPLQNSQVQLKQKETMLRKYGVESPLQSEIIKEKYKKTLKERYGNGINSTLSVQEVQDKIKDTMMLRYGVLYPGQKPDFNEKRQATTLARFGVNHVSQAPEIQEKRKKTTLSNYGVEFIGSAKSVKQKRKSTVKQKYGVENIKQIGQSDETKEFLSNTEMFTQLVSEYSLETLAKRFGISPYPIYSRMKELGLKPIKSLTSVFEKEVVEYIRSIYSGTIIENDRTILKPKELDIYLPELNLAIECNGIYWHSMESGTNILYHYDKTSQCSEQGIDLLNIWDYEWDTIQDQLKMQLHDLITDVKIDISSIPDILTISRSSDILLERAIRPKYSVISINEPDLTTVNGFTIYNSGSISYKRQKR